MYIRKALLYCLKFEVQVDMRACSRARAKTGKRIAARMAIIAITTSSSISVKPRCCPRRGSIQADLDLLDITQPFLSVGTERGPDPRRRVEFSADEEPSVRYRSLKEAAYA